MAHCGGVGPILLPPQAVLLHIGPHKTGTTAVQSALASARPRLKTAGVLYPGRADHPAVQEAFNRVAGIVLESGKTLGILTVSVENTLEWRRRGARFFLSVFEAVMVPAIRSYLEKSRGE